MRGWCFDQNDGQHLLTMLPELLNDHRRARRVHLIWDGSSSHIAAETAAFLWAHDLHVQTLLTPEHPSSPNQAELLLRAVSEHYLVRGEWASRQ